MTIKHWKMTSVSASTAIDGDALEKCCSCHSGTQDLRPCTNTSGMLTITANKVRSTSEITKAHCQAAATEQTTFIQSVSAHTFTYLSIQYEHIIAFKEHVVILLPDWLPSLPVIGSVLACRRQLCSDCIAVRQQQTIPAIRKCA